MDRLPFTYETIGFFCERHQFGLVFTSCTLTRNMCKTYQTGHKLGTIYLMLGPMELEFWTREGKRLASFSVDFTIKG